MKSTISVKPTRTMAARSFKNDGWTNVLSGLGKLNTDKTKHTQIDGHTILLEQDLTSIWIGDGLGSKVVYAVSNDMIKNWITIPDDSEDKILKELKRLNAKEKFNEALNWSRLYQGSIIVMHFKNSGDLEKEVNLKTAKEIEFLKVYPSTRIDITTESFNKDPKSKYFGDVEVFRITTITGETIRVHRSRCLVFKGIPVPANANGVDLKMRYWGMSVLQRVWDRIKNFGAIEQGIANLMYELVIGKYKLAGLEEILAGNNTAAVYTRLEIINASKSIINAVLLGENEEYTRDTVNVAGISDILDRFMMLLSAVTEIPVTRLFGRSPAGQNATGESDLRNYYDVVTGQQEVKLERPLQLLVSIINNTVKVSGDVAIEFNSVWEPTPKETADIRKLNAETDKIYIDSGAVTPEEVTNTTAVQEHYNIGEGSKEDPNLEV